MRKEMDSAHRLVCRVNDRNAEATVRDAVVRRVATVWGVAAGIIMPPMLNKVADSAIAAGRVNTQARPIFRTVSPWIPERLAHMVPATPEERTWVVLTGIWTTSAKPIVTAATNSAAAPWA
jgi:hypothetical protein